MKALTRRVLVGLLAVVAVGLLFKNLVWPFLHKYSALKARAMSGLASAPIGVSNPPVLEAIFDLAIAQTNVERWTKSPRRDPFMAPKFGSKEARNQRTAMEVLTLKAILHQRGSSLAVIDSQVLTEGEMVRDYKVARIGAERVWVDGPLGREEMVFDYASALRVNAQKAGGILENPLVGQESRLDWPHRAIGDLTYNAITDKGWFLVGGKVRQKLATGSYLIESTAEEVLGSPVAKGRRFIVKNLPLALVDDDQMPTVRCKYDGDEPHQDKTLRVFNFGVLCAPPRKTVESLQAQRVFLLQQYAEANRRRTKLDTTAAESGNASAQFILAQRYLQGEGVPKDVPEGRRWLEKSAAQGNLDASEALRAPGKQ